MEETEVDPKVTDDEYEERVLANYANRSDDYELYADENVTAEYRFRYRETTKKNNILSYKKTNTKRATKKCGTSTKSRKNGDGSGETEMPITKPLSVVVHRMSQNEIHLAMSKPYYSEVNTENLEFVDSLWSEDDMRSEAEVSGQMDHDRKRRRCSQDNCDKSSPV